MNIKIGIYDFFAHTIPGSFYFFIIIYFLNQANLIKIDLMNFKPSFSQFVFLAILSYIIGLLFDRISRSLWYRFFAYKPMWEKSYEELKKSHPRFEMKFDANEWPILLSNIKRENVNEAADISKFNAMHIMLRNISFALIVTFILKIMQFFFDGYSFANLIISITSIAFSLIAVRRAELFEKYFYNMIFESTIGQCLDTSKLVNINNWGASNGKNDNCDSEIDIKKP